MRGARTLLVTVTALGLCALTASAQDPDRNTIAGSIPGKGDITITGVPDPASGGIMSNVTAQWAGGPSFAVSSAAKQIRVEWPDRAPETFWIQALWFSTALGSPGAPPASQAGEIGGFWLIYMPNPCPGHSHYPVGVEYLLVSRDAGGRVRDVKGIQGAELPLDDPSAGNPTPTPPTNATPWGPEPGRVYIDNPHTTLSQELVSIAEASAGMGGRFQIYQDLDVFITCPCAPGQPAGAGGRTDPGAIVNITQVSSIILPSAPGASTFDSGVLDSTGAITEVPDVVGEISKQQQKRLIVAGENTEETGKTMNDVTTNPTLEDRPRGAVPKESKWKENRKD